MAYDPVRRVTVLFGGLSRNANNTVTYRNDTWTFNGTTWSQVASPTTPPGREGHTLVYDPVRGGVLLIEGSDGALQDFRDVWLFNGSTWTLIVGWAVAPTPNTRGSGAFAYDPVRSEVVLTGGFSQGTTLNDTWVLPSSASAWSSKPVSGPGGRYGATLSWFPPLAASVLVGGETASGGAYVETSFWNGTSWSSTLAVSAGRRSEHCAVTDTVRNRVIVFGGTDPLTGTNRDDTVEYDGATWTTKNLTVKPSARAYASMAWDSVRGRAVLFGGPNLPAETWEYGP